jgi:acyl-CoA thioester hydrolase
MKTQEYSEPRSCITICDFDPLPYEVDFTGFLSNTVVVRWMESLRVKMMRDFFPEFDTGKKENLSVITKAEIDYMRPVRYGTKIKGAAWIGGLTKAQWRIRFEFTAEFDDKPSIMAFQKGAFVDPFTLQPIRIPSIIESKVR